MIQRLRHRIASDAGLGLVEVMVALSLMTILLTSVAFTLTKQMTMGRDSKAREGALDLASQAIDQARASSDFSTLVGARWTDTMNNETYTVTRSVTTYLQNGSGSPCDGTGSSSVAYKAISVSVTWTGMANPTVPVRSQTLLSPNVTSYDPTLGNLGVRVRDASGAPVEGAQVVSSGPSGSRTSFTDESGCAFVEQRTPGLYTATVSRSGYVAPDGTTAPSKSVTVQAAQTVSVAFELDVTATLTLNLANGTFPPPASVPVTLGNTSLVPNGRLTVAGTGTPRSVVNRYPYESGYTVWTGSCDDADPEGAVLTEAPPPATSAYYGVMDPASGGRYHPGVSRSAAIAAKPEPYTNTGVVDMAEVQVQVLNTAGQPVPNAPVTMTHVPWDTTASPVAFPGCPAGESYALGSTGTGGNVYAGTPWGYWDFTSSLVGAVPTRVWLHPGTSTTVVQVRVT